MRRSRHALQFLALFVLVSSLKVAQDDVPPPDERVQRVDAFFDSYNCPEPNYASDYVRSADRHGVDYRMLPVISLLESTCGSYQRLNNYWGWNSARTGFPSVEHGIDYVTSRLAEHPAYKGRTLDAKFLSYNPRASYGRLAKRLMKKIEP